MDLGTIVRHKNYAFYEAHNLSSAILGIVVKKKGLWECNYFVVRW